MNKNFKLNIIKIKVLQAFNKGFCGSAFEVTEVKNTKYGPTVSIPEYSLLLKSGETVRKFQRSMFKLAGIPASIDGTMVGSIMIGNAQDQEEIQVYWSQKTGLVLKAPGYSATIKGQQRFVFYRNFYDRYNYSITHYVHAAILRIFAEIAGFDSSLPKRKGDSEDDCRKCKAYRRLITSDPQIGDSIEGLELRSKSIGETVNSGPYQTNWICGLTGVCPVENTIAQANRESTHGNCEKEIKNLLAEESKNTAYYCNKFHKENTISHHSMELTTERTANQNTMTIVVPAGVVRFAYITPKQ